MGLFDNKTVPPPGDPWYAVALDSIADAVIAADAQGRVTYLNPTAEQLTGWGREQAVGQDIARVYDVVDEETGQEVARVLADIARGGEVIQVMVDMLLVAKGGVHTSVKDSAAPIRDEHKAVIGVVVTFRDTSSERKAQREIEDLNHRLRLAVAEMNHRVKNNLQIVAALVEMQAQSETEPLPARAAQRLALHVQTLAQIHGLLADQAINTDIDTLSARDTVAKLVPLLQATVSPRLVQFTGEEMQLSPRLASALALITNELVSNSFKHSLGRIEVELAIEDGSAHLQVRDSGSGFAPDFDVRVAAHTGLEMVESLARHDMNGSVRYENLPEGGGCVTVTFPLPPQQGEIVRKNR